VVGGGSSRTQTHPPCQIHFLYIYLLKHFAFVVVKMEGALYPVISCQEQASISRSKMLAEMGVSLFEMSALHF